MPPRACTSTCLALAAAAVLGGLAGCGERERNASDPSGPDAAGAPALDVLASFYPLEWLAGQVGGDLVRVTSLTPPGAEPHDLELTPSDVARLSDASLVVFLSGFQPAVDHAVDGAGGASFDAAEAAGLGLRFTPIEEGVEAADETGIVDPHFWLDPLRTAAAAEALAVALAGIDPANAEVYAANADRLGQELEALDAELEAGLATCADRYLVTSHNAFGYLAQRYGFEQVGITGLTPEGEPTPSAIAAVSRFVEANDVATIYFETLVSPAIAETIAAETGAATAVLDPIEGLSDASQGSDYLEVMRSNLATLRAGQSCT